MCKEERLKLFDNAEAAVHVAMDEFSKKFGCELRRGEEKYVKIAKDMMELIEDIREGKKKAENENNGL